MQVIAQQKFKGFTIQIVQAEGGVVLHYVQGAKEPWTSEAWGQALIENYYGQITLLGAIGDGLGLVDAPRIRCDNGVVTLEFQDTIITREYVEVLAGMHGPKRRFRLSEPTSVERARELIQQRQLMAELVIPLELVSYEYSEDLAFEYFKGSDFVRRYTARIWDVKLRFTNPASQKLYLKYRRDFRWIAEPTRAASIRLHNTQLTLKPGASGVVGLRLTRDCVVKRCKLIVARFGRSALFRLRLLPTTVIR